MSSVEPGTVLVDRYRLVEPVPTDLADGEAWSAHDQILDRPVRATLLHGPRAAEALDSARRAALVADPRIARVLDVGTADALGGMPYVISEPSTGASLQQVVSSGLVDPQQARAVVGEAAAALEAARRRGVHHLALRPEAVRVDGHRVLVTGLGLDAGLGGQDQHDAATTSRADATALVALLYYLLTARWPGSSLDVPWIAPDAVRPLPAQAQGDGVVPLSALVPHVGTELDELVALTFGPGDQGPATPADVVGALEPWGQVSVVAALPSFVQPAAPETLVRQSVLGGFGGTTAPPGTPPPAPPVRRPATGRIHRTGAVPAVGVAGLGALAGAQAAQAASAGPGAPTAPVGADGAGGAYGDPAATAAYPAAYPATAGYPAPGYPPATDPQATAAYAAVPPGAAAAAPAGGAPHAGGHAPVPPPPGGYAPAPGPVSEPVPPRKKRAVNPTPIVLGLVGVGVVVGLWWAIGNAFDPLDPAVSQPSATAGPSSDASPGATDGGGEEAPATPQVPDVRPVIASGNQVDPEGDGQHPEAVALAWDGDPSTFWYTQYFKSSNFGGLKAGVGYAITLQEDAPVTQIELNTNSEGGHVQVRATSADDPAGGTVLAEGPVSSSTTFEMPEGTHGTSFVLWITDLPLTGDKYMIELNEITVS